jgi:hypothetical protein
VAYGTISPKTRKQKEKEHVMLGLLTLGARVAATASEIFLGATATGLGAKVAYDTVKQNGSPAYHQAKIAEIEEAKVKKEKKEREAKEKADEKASQELAIHFIRNIKHASGLEKMFGGIFTKS